MGKACVCIVCLFLLLIPASLSAEDTEKEPEIRLMTIGQHDPVYIWFGHTSLIVDEPETGESTLYDYGVFDFQQERFYLNFAMGRLIYAKTASPPERHIYAAQRDERNLRIITLDIPAEQREETAEFLEREVLPGNDTYLYHHYYDNCSTRVRDIIDRATGGQFKEWAQAQSGRMTYREHFSRHAPNSFWMLWLLNFLQGSVIDYPITRWDEMFLPLELEAAVLEFSYTDPSGIQRELAADKLEVLNYAHRQEIPGEWEGVWPKGLAAGLLFAAAAAAGIWRLYRWAKGRSAQGLRVYGLIQAVFGLAFGLIGSILLFMMVFTDHDVTRQNINLWMVNPLWLAAVFYGISAMRGNARSVKPLVYLWRGISVLSLIMVLYRPFMTYPQGNELSMAMFLPLIFIQGQWWLCFKAPPYVKQLFSR